MTENPWNGDKRVQAAKAGEPMIADGKYSLSIGGGQPATGAPTELGTFQVKGTKTLLE